MLTNEFVSFEQPGQELSEYMFVQLRSYLLRWPRIEFTLSLYFLKIVEYVYCQDVYFFLIVDIYLELIHSK